MTDTIKSPASRRQPQRNARVDDPELWIFGARDYCAKLCQPSIVEVEVRPPRFRCWVAAMCTRAAHSQFSDPRSWAGCRRSTSRRGASGTVGSAAGSRLVDRDHLARLRSRSESWDLLSWCVRPCAWRRPFRGSPRLRSYRSYPIAKRRPACTRRGRPGRGLPWSRLRRAHRRTRRIRRTRRRRGSADHLGRRGRQREAGSPRRPGPRSPPGPRRRNRR